jgi:outer membrane receptor protein involved in Fe transport
VRNRRKDGSARFRASCLISALACLQHAAPASAVEEIVVTTRKKAENLQDVPIAVNAIGAEQIERQGISSLADIVKLTPSAQFDTAFGPQDTRITIRGLSNTRGRSNVAFLVDGIDVTTENAITAGSGLLANRRLLGDVERVEIVKGPQSALYGRAAFAGAISYITKEPKDELTGKLNADFGNFGHREIGGSFGGPVFGDKMGGLVNGVYWSDDGFYNNSVSGGQVGAGHGIGASLTGVFKPIDGMKIKARVEYSHDLYSPAATVRIAADTPRTYPYGTQLDWIIDPAYPNLDPKKPVVDPNYPAAGIARVAQPSKSLTFTTYLPYFGLYCNGVYDKTKPAGLCLPSTFGSASGKQVRFSEDPNSVKFGANGFPAKGSDFPGTDVKTFRASVVGSWEFHDIGTVTSYSGFTYSRNSQLYDQDYQASGRPDLVFDPLVNQDGVSLGGTNKEYAAQWTDSRQRTDQLSQELRFASSWRGPVQATIGGLYWHEKRTLIENNTILDCLPIAATSLSGSLTNNSGACAARSWQELALKLKQDIASYESANGPLICDDVVVCASYTGHRWTGAPWIAETNHLSAYLSLDIKFTDDLTLTLEDRYIRERFSFLKPNQAPCGPLGFTLAPFPSGSDAAPFYCIDVQTLTTPKDNLVDPVGNPLPLLGQSTSRFTPYGTSTFRLLEGREFTSFNTPKAILNWKIQPDKMLYASWALAEKPGGINQLSGGSCCIEAGFYPSAVAGPNFLKTFLSDPLEREHFKPEKMMAYEAGFKTSWEAAGFLQVNAAGFFEDYTDKQVTISELLNGRLQPRVTNASGAQVWGAELELVWQPSFMEGLTLAGNYTWLDPRYTKYIQRSQSLLHLAAVGQCPKVELEIDKSDGTLKPLCVVDYSGKQLERTPKNAFAGSASLRRPLFDSGLEYITELDAQFQDERFLDEDNFTRFNSFWLVNVRFGLTSPKWELIAYVSNVLDDDTLKTGGSGPDFGKQASDLGFTAGLGVLEYFGSLPDPRTYGLRLSYRF